MLIFSNVLIFALTAIFILFCFNLSGRANDKSMYKLLALLYFILVSSLAGCIQHFYQSAQYWEAQFWKNDKLAADLLREKEKERLKYAKFIRLKGYSLDSINIINPEN